MNTEVIDVEGLKRLSGNDNVFVSEILKLYAERTVRDIAELTCARNSGDWNTIRFVVHRMRSAAVPLGLKKLVVLLKKVELGIKDGEMPSDLEANLDEIFRITRNAIADAKAKLLLVSV
jgi:HPt (histidine-containing phosphotransfer) domain-containing protein